MKIFDFKFLLLALLIGSTSCSEDTGFPEFSLSDESYSFIVTEVILPSSGVELYSGENQITIQGKGFQATDKIYATLDSSATQLYVLGVDDLSATCQLPEMESGMYTFTVVRNGVEQKIGEMILEFTPFTHLEVSGDENIYGRVYCGQQTLAGVTVSDGVEVVQTDANGVYRINSDKKYGNIFVTAPNGYKVKMLTTIPSFFHSTSSDTSKLEEHNFALEQCDAEDFTLFVTADMHLASRNNDLSQFALGFVPDIYNAAVSAQASSEVLSLDLGDISWDAYWYSNKFGLYEAINYLEFYPMPLYPTIGNHDHDPYYEDDFESEQTYRSVVGPTFYSFNIGDIHVVVLDNIVYKNSGGTIGAIGDRSYDRYVTSDQYAWLSKDLAAVTDKTKPLIVAVHNPPVSATGWSGDDVTLTSSFSSTTHLSNFNSAFSSFSDVHVLSGHQHENSTLISGNITSHCIGAVSATWWWTGYLGNGHICRDGSPGGYKVFNISGDDVSWYYKSIGQDADYQFRAYDLNEISAAYGGEPGGNKILVNIWDWDTNWTLTATEGTTELATSPVWGKDLLHLIAYTESTEDFMTVDTHHLFEIQALSATEPVAITATNGQGVSYTQIIERPKMFSISMK